MILVIPATAVEEQALSTHWDDLNQAVACDSATEIL
jgi:hypothetical protein